MHPLNLFLKIRGTVCTPHHTHNARSFIIIFIIIGISRIYFQNHCRQWEREIHWPKKKKRREMLVIVPYGSIYSNILHCAPIFRDASANDLPFWPSISFPSYSFHDISPSLQQRADWCFAPCSSSRPLLCKRTRKYTLHSTSSAGYESQLNHNTAKHLHGPSFQ